LKKDARKQAILELLAKEARDKSSLEGEICLDSILRAHLKSIKDGLVFFVVRFDNSLKYSAELLTFAKQEFLARTKDIVRENCMNYGATQAVILLVNETEIHSDVVEQMSSDLQSNFDHEKIVLIPATNWTCRDVEYWLTKHSGLGLSHPERKEIAMAAITD